MLETLMITNPIVFSVGQRRRIHIQIQVRSHHKWRHPSLSHWWMSLGHHFILVSPLNQGGPITPPLPVVLKIDIPMPVTPLHTIGGQMPTMEGEEGLGIEVEVIIRVKRKALNIMNTLDMIDHLMGGSVIKVTITKITITLREHPYIQPVFTSHRRILLRSLQFTLFINVQRTWPKK